MKTRLFTIFLFLIAANSISAQSISEKWPAVKDLHTVVSQTFHPAEEGNLEPIKSRSQELADKSAALLKSDIPAEFRTNAILNAAEKMQTKTKALHKMVIAKAADVDMTKMLNEIHDLFHEIDRLCDEKK